METKIEYFIKAELKDGKKHTFFLTHTTVKEARSMVRYYKSCDRDANSVYKYRIIKRTITEEEVK